MINKEFFKKRGKKGSTFEGWTEGMIFSIMFVIVFGMIVIGGMNLIHEEDYAIEGLETGGIESTFENYQTSQSEKIAGGDASFLSAVGLTLSTSWDVLTGTLKMLMDFITGGWVESLVSYLALPEEVGYLLRGLWIVTFGFIVLRILFRKERI